MSGRPGIMCTVDHLLDAGYPACAVSMAMVRVGRELANLGDYKALEGMLRTMWLTITPHVAEIMMSKKGFDNNDYAVAASFLERYFADRGDWRKMEATLRNHIESDQPHRRPDIEKLLADMSDAIRRQAK